MIVASPDFEEKGTGAKRDSEQKLGLGATVHNGRLQAFNV